MAGGEDRKIKFSFLVDKQGLLEAKSAIGSLTQSVKALADELARAGASMGQLGGGKGGNPFFSGVTSKAGGGSGLGNNSQVGGSNAKIGISSGIASDAIALRDTARAGTDALRGMTSGVKSSVGSQIQDIQRLKKELRDLNSEFDKASRGGQLMTPYAMDLQAKAQRTGNELASAHISEAKRLAPGNVQQELVTVDGISYEKGSEPKKWYSKERLGGMVGGWGQAAAGVGVVAAAAKGYDMYRNFGNGIDQAQNTQALGAPGQRLGREAAFGSIFGGSALGVQQGRIGQAWAMNLAMNQGKLMNPVMHGDAEREQNARIASGFFGIDKDKQTRHLGGLIRDDVTDHFKNGGTFGGLLKQGGSDLYNRVRGWGESIGNYAAGDEGTRVGERTRAHGLTDANPAEMGLDRGTKSAAQIAHDLAGANMGVDKAKEIQANAAAIQARDPLFYARIDRVYNDASGRVSMGRSGNYGGGAIKTGPDAGLDRMDVLESHLKRSGWDMGSYMGSRRSMMGTAGAGFAGALGTSALSAASGGLQGVEGIFGAGAQFGNGRASSGNALFKAVQGTIGRGGMDVTAGGSLANSLIGSAMTSGQFGNGMEVTPAIQALAGMGMTGTTGGDMRMSRTLQQGMGSWGNMLSGGIDPLQGALNVSAANTSMRGKSWGSKEAVMNLDPTSMLSILKGGDKNLPWNLKNLGVNTGDVRGYANAQTNTQFARALDTDFDKGSNAGNALKGVRAHGGNWKEYLRGRKGSGVALGDDVRSLASVLSKTTGVNPETAYGQLMAQLAAEDDFSGAPKGKGSWAAGMAKKDKAALTGAGDVLHDEAKDTASQEKAINEITKNAASLRKQAEAARKGGVNGADGAGQANAAIGAYTAELGQYTAELKVLVQGMKQR